MYKLVVIAGILRGNEFNLNEGENIIGSGIDCDIQLSVAGVSKKHLSITVTDNVAYIKDLNSSNGTFLNGKLIKSATAENGDKITVPDLIIQLVYVAEKKIFVKRKIEESEDDYLSGGEVPVNLLPKILHLFKYKILRILYGINEEYEWRVLFAIILAIFCILIISLTIFPVLRQSKLILLLETAKRGAHFAEEISRMNSRALEQKMLDKVDTKFLDTEPGVKSYELFDLQGRIVRPMSRMNEYTSDVFSLEAKAWALMPSEKGLSSVLTRDLKNGEIGIAKKILVFNPRLASEEAVGIIAIHFKPRLLAFEAAQSSRAYLESLVTSGIVAFFFFGIVYFLTLRHLEEMKFQIEEALRGKRRNLESRYLMLEMTPLRNSINSALQRIRELSHNEDDSEFAELEGDESYVRALSEFMTGSGVPVITLNSDKNIANINVEAEDVCGIRENASQGASLLDVSREKGFAATIIELCDNSANNGGTCQQGEYEIQGEPYQIFVNSLIGKDSFAKAFYITLLKEEV